MGCESIAVLPTSFNSPVPIYKPGCREALLEEKVLLKKKASARASQGSNTDDCETAPPTTAKWWAMN